MYTVAVSYLEWIRWVATGWFRCADRVVWVEGADDQSGIDALLDRTPDLHVSDDQGYVIACLRADSLISSRHAGLERSVGNLWLSVAAVSSFHPLSIRGARLLEADAERAAVRLDKPLFEKAWTDWRDRRLEDEAHWRGLSLCAAFGLDPPVLKDISHQVSDILAGRKAPPNAARVREDAIEGTRALGWASAMSVAVMESDVRTAFKETPEYVEIQSLIKAYRNDFDLLRPMLDDETTVTFVRGIDVVLRKLGAQVLPLELMATVLHYRSLATSGRQLTLDAIIDDLVVIALEDPQHASLAAYCIGRSMENVAVTTLLYQSEPERYAALAPAAARTHLNVMSLAASRLEARRTVDQDQKTNPRCVADANAAKQNLDTKSGSAAEAGVEQTVSGQQTVLEGSISLSGASLAVAVSPPDPNIEGLKKGSLVGVVESQGCVIPALSDEVGKKVNQIENSSTQPLNEPFPQAINGKEKIASSTNGKRNQKKSDKTPAARSAVEMPDDTMDK